jgi:hypothetical protein
MLGEDPLLARGTCAGKTLDNLESRRKERGWQELIADETAKICTFAKQLDISTVVRKSRISVAYLARVAAYAEAY